MSLDLDAIEKRAAAATPGPWSPGEHAPFSTILWPAVFCENPGHTAFGDHVALCNYDDKDAKFIAAAREDVPALVARVRELEAEKAASGATDDEVRAVLAEYTAKIDAAIEKGKTNLGCHWCGEVADITDPTAIDLRYRTCPKSPLVIEIAALKAAQAEVNEALRLTVYALRHCHGHMEHDDWNTVRRALGEPERGDDE